MLKALKRNNTKEFYKLFKRKRSKNTQCPLSAENFREYFQSVMVDNSSSDRPDPSGTDYNDCIFPELDAPITEDAIMTEI
jgi:hypothetical protein